MNRERYNIHGDNIVECVRVLNYIVAGLGNLTKSVTGPLESIACPVYLVQTEESALQFQLLPGYGERRWNQDILGVIRLFGGRLREAADAIVTRVHEEREEVMFAVEFCGALPAGNQAWQRQGRAFSFACAGIPYFCVSELGGFELTSDRRRKHERMPNPAVPFSFLSITRYRDSVCLPIYEANSGAAAETVERYEPLFGSEDFLKFLRLAMTNDRPMRVAPALTGKCMALVELLADSRARQDGLSGAQWRMAHASIVGGSNMLDFLSGQQKIAWKKRTHISRLTGSARKFMELGASDSWGLTSSRLPMSFVPKARRPIFSKKAKAIYPDLPENFRAWLAKSEKHLAIAWVTGFKPRGDDARPDRGLAPLARMLIGDDAELLTFIYGPAPAWHYDALHQDPAGLAARNGLWEAIFASSDGLLLDGINKPAAVFRGYQKDAWADFLKKEKIPLKVHPQLRMFGEHDVDTALHVAFESLGDDIIFEGMCNPPGGDWSGVSFRWGSGESEYRWLTLPRESPESGKRPDHVFALFGCGPRVVCLCVESKGRAGAFENNIGPRLVRYVKDLLNTPPSICRDRKTGSWSVCGESWKKRDTVFLSAGAYPLSDPADPLRDLPRQTKLDLQIGVVFREGGRHCAVYLRGTSPKGKLLADYLADLKTWSDLVTVAKISN
ncbi:MAG: hypothetical protein MPK06_00255 [Alphaproteobacteria bacterium]|nr:hypothetical protein [Alphaproteobacteria bacterium]MDA8003755.1 hypothetical protein [Alphaproteobacteria bacterium]MDA8004974.1 hypothetical protein [Alphaproteobacteria bacterium]MDA8012961.1 hypothetical protein [Alphaproteobacteria bacterium]